MNESIDYITILKGLVISILILIIVFISSCLDQRTKLVFCDVGQGDGAYIRIKNKVDVLVDAGPDRKILNCLGRYMPFYDRTIELGFISHDQKDHFGGFDYILDRYRIKTIYMPDLDSSLQSFERLKEKMKIKKTRFQTVTLVTRIRIGNYFFYIHWPNRHCIASDNNDCSLVVTFEEKSLFANKYDFRALFTGDSPPNVLNNLSRKSIQKATILKISHHGSKKGLTEKFLRLADPVVAVISVGKSNSYGHPNKEILDMLESAKIKIKRTDKDGDIVYML